MNACEQIMEDISKRMSVHGRIGAFTSRSYVLSQKGQRIGIVTVKYYGPFFFSESDFTFLNALNIVLIIIGVLSLVFSFAAGWLLARRITRTIRKTADIAGQIAAGRYDARFEGQTKTRELQELVDAINHLATALAGQENLRKRLTADVSHEIRTPLTTLGSHIEAMIEGIWEPTPERLKSCHEEIRRLTKMVSDLERLERADTGNLKLKKTPMDLLALAKTVCDNFAGQLAGKSQRLEIAGTETVVPADRDRIGGIITNLVSNAVKYTPEGGEINVFIQDSPSAGLFIIEDDGPGISEHELPFIFERLYRADKSRNRDTGGAGIGLAIVKSIVTAHDGTVTVENLKDGGCRFTVKLPKSVK
jgi:signal transduction histidine kinase